MAVPEFAARWRSAPVLWRSKVNSKEASAGPTLLRPGTAALRLLAIQQLRTMPTSRHPLPCHRIIKRPHHSIRARRADLHFLPGNLMKEKRRAVSVNHLALCIHAQTGIRRDEIDLLRIL